MLQLMREKFKSLKWILWAVIASFVAWVFVAWGVGTGGGMSGGPDDTNVAVDIDGRIVTRVDFIRRLRNQEQLYRSQFGEQADQFLQQLNVRQQVLQQLVMQEVALREAERIGLEATPREVTDLILKRFVDESGRFRGREYVERVARGAGYTDEQFVKAVADEILYRKLALVVEAGATVTDKAVEAEYRRRNDKAEVGYVWLDASALARDLAPTDQELRAFFEVDPAKFAAKERQARYVVYANDAYAAAVEVADEDLRSAYEDPMRQAAFQEQRSARHILLKTTPDMDDVAQQQLREEAEELAGRARAGEDFAELARQSSEDSSAGNGGDLGYFGRGRMVEPFEDAVFAADAQPGAILGPVKSDFGFHVIKLEAIRPARSFEEARPDLEKQLRTDRARVRAREAAQAAIARAGESSLDDIAKEAGLKVVESPFLRADARAAGLPDIDAAYVPTLIRSLFAVEATSGISPTPLAIGNGFAVLQFHAEKGPVTPEFAAVEDEVRKELLTSRGQAMATEKLAALRKDLDAGTSLADAATAIGEEVKTASLSRGASLPGVPDSERAGTMAYELPLDQPSDPIALPGGQLVLRVTSRFEFDAARFEAEKESLRTELEDRQKQSLLDNLIRSLRNDLESRQKIRYVAADLFSDRDEPTPVF